MTSITFDTLMRNVAFGLVFILAMGSFVKVNAATPLSLDHGAVSSRHAKWIGVKQFGTPGTERAYTSALDHHGNLYVTGFTTGDLDGEGPEVSSGSFDIFVMKIRPDGTTAWTRQLGSAQDDRSHYVAVDRWGYVYVTGHSSGDLDGDGAQTHKGIDDAFLLKLDEYGRVQWIRQFGSPEEDMGFGVAVNDSGNVYVTGYTFLGDMDGDGPAVNQGNEDVFLAAFDFAGNQKWIQQIGSPDSDVAYGVAVDARGGIYVAGLSFGDFDGPGTQVHLGDSDIVALKFNRQGDVRWIRQMGTPGSDFGYALKVNRRHAYISGFVSGDLDGSGPDVHAGQTDLAVLKVRYNADLVWTRQIGTAENDIAHGIAVDKYGDVYATGTISGDLDGPGPQTYQGRGDVVVVKFNRDGVTRWTRQQGSTQTDLGLDVTVDRKRRVYVTGQTDGDFDGAGPQPYAGDSDLFVLKLWPWKARIEPIAE